MRYSKSSSQRDIHSQKKKAYIKNKNDLKQPNSSPKGTKKRTTN